MKYSELVKSFNAATDAKKASVVKKHIVVDYIPFNIKIAEAKEIVDRAHYTEISGKRVYQRNSPTAYYLFIVRIISLYTDIEWEKDEVVDMFNEFAKSGLIDEIIMSLPKGEYDSFKTILDMVTDDDYENYRSLAGFLGTKLEALGMMLEALSNSYTEVGEKPES